MILKVHKVIKAVITMKRILFIVSIVVCLASLTTLTGQTPSSKPLYTDDAYYWPVVDTIVPSTPIYDRSAREFIFLEDTTQSPDTVVMRIVEK